MRITIGIIISLFLASIALADDPGIPDTIIVGTVYAEIGQPYVDVPVYAVTDDSLDFYAMPIIWSSNSDEIRPFDVFYHQMLIYWDTFDSLLTDPEFLRMVAGGSRYHCLNTYGSRLHCWDIRFAIDSMATPQIVTVDTGYDPVNGSILFGLVGGVEVVIPQFIPGAIYYGIPTPTSEDDRALPSDIVYLQSYPNPFNASTSIEITLPDAADIDLAVYNILGQKIAVLFDGQKTEGRHSVTWNAGDMPSGVYFARLEIGRYSKNIKIVLLK
jgi:hypothetical protein